MCAMPTPEVHLHLHMEFQDCCKDCCKNTCNQWQICSHNTRIVASNDYTLEPERRSFISKLFLLLPWKRPR